MTLSNIEIVDAARLLYEEWQRQRARSVVEEPQIRERFRVTDYVAQGDDGFSFSIGENEYDASWFGEDNEFPDVDRAPSLEDIAARAFTNALCAFVKSQYRAVHHAVERLGWYWLGDEEFYGTYYHDDADHVIVMPHWCDDFDEIEFPEVE